MKIKLSLTWGIHWDSTHRMLFIFILPFIGLTVYIKRSVKPEPLPDGYVIQRVNTGTKMLYRAYLYTEWTSRWFPTRKDAVKAIHNHHKLHKI